MLNCCINHKKSNQSGSSTDATFVDEEEFFDAEETIDTTREEELPSKQRHSAWNQPQGRKERTKMKLLRSGEFLYIPVSQEPLPMTEDVTQPNIY